jgi:hypothetical protein
MNIPGFTEEALAAVEELLYAEYKNKYAGQCGQKQLREQNKTQRTAAQQAGDQARAAKLRGRSRMSGGTRSEAAKKAAETRKQCSGRSQPI